MQRIKFILCFAFLLTTTVAEAEQHVPADHSTVHIVFVVPNEAAHIFGSNSLSVRVGNTNVPASSVRPISIEIDGDFVGHALLASYPDIKPIFVLPSGDHEFKFTREGFKDSSAKLKVLGSGSKQYLVVKMESGSPTKRVAPDGKKAPVTGAR